MGPMPFLLRESIFPIPSWPKEKKRSMVLSIGRLGLACCPFDVSVLCHRSARRCCAWLLMHAHACISTRVSAFASMAMACLAPPIFVSGIGLVPRIRGPSWAPVKLTSPENHGRSFCSARPHHSPLDAFAPISTSMAPSCSLFASLFYSIHPLSSIIELQRGSACHMAHHLTVPWLCYFLMFFPKHLLVLPLGLLP